MPALELRHDVETTTARLRYLDEAHSTIKKDVAVTKRATEKATSDVSKAQKDKLQQVSCRHLAHILNINFYSLTILETFNVGFLCGALDL